jgi:hypothetical protein
MGHIKRDTNEAPHGWLAKVVISQFLDGEFLCIYL